MYTGFIPVHITMQEILKQKSKNKKPKTFGAVNNAYEIYHLVQVLEMCNIEVWLLQKKRFHNR